MNPNYRIEIQPPLIEAAVMRVMANHPEPGLFWRERERLYENVDAEAREATFQNFHKSWFNRFELLMPLQQVLKTWPVLTSATSRCLLLCAPVQKHVGAELYIFKDPGTAARERRTIVVQLTPELLSNPRLFLEFLRHEFFHLVDMLDSHFGYEPSFPKSQAGPAYDHLLQSRYAVLWDIIIDGRLFRRGWLPEAARDRHFSNFRRTFQGAGEKIAEVFAHFFDQNSHTHRELVEFAQHPEKWLAGETGQAAAKGRCAICHFPTFQLINPGGLDTARIAKIQKLLPEWNGVEPVCRQCVDLYEAKFYQNAENGGFGHCEEQSDEANPSCGNGLVAEESTGLNQFGCLCSSPKL